MEFAEDNVASQEALIDCDIVSWRGLRWPKETPIHQRHLMLWKKHREYPYSDADFLNPISEHFLEACRILFTPAQLGIHPWFEECAEDYTMNEGIVYWGSASSGKSHFMGIAFLLDYFTDPTDTFILLASTTKDMLKLRTYASVVEYLNLLRSNPKIDCPYKYINQSMTVTSETIVIGDVASAKAVIKGVAINEGSTKESRAAVQGVHLKYVRIGADELPAMRPAILEARHNLAMADDFKFVAAANPESMFDICGVVSEPEAGYKSIDIDTKHWKTKAGWSVRRFDAFESPGIKEPEKYPYLPTQDKIDRIMRENNNNPEDPNVYTFLRAYPPPQGAEQTVLTETMIKSYEMREEVIWKSTPIKLAGFDPAFTSGGDNAIFQTADLGYIKTGLLVLCFDKTFKLKISATSNVPVLEQLVEQVAEIMQDENIKVAYLGVDDSGTQSCADAIEMRMGRGVYRCCFNMKPPDLEVSVANPAKASTRYKDMITWAYFTVREYAQRGQIKGLPLKAADQFCTRRIKEKRPLQLESKKDLKKRTHGQSPDEADSCAIISGMVRERHGVVPGTSEWAPQGAQVNESMNWATLAMAKSLNNLSTSYGSV